MRKPKCLIKSLILPLIAGVVWLLMGSSHAYAATSFNFTDHLMDDDVMRASNTMSAMEIQNFLQAKGSGLASFSDTEDCGPTNGSHYSYYTNYYSCGQKRSAAQIIYDSSQAYGINPKVILATLQKEQSLITTPNPTASQLNYAMGYGCPDSGGCSYPGFFNQVDNGTWQFRTDMELGGGNNYWGYTPASYPCQGSPNHQWTWVDGNGVAHHYYYSYPLIAGNNITFWDDNGTAYANFTLPNMATATLYCYTPHVYNNPNGINGVPRYGTTGQYYTGSYNFYYYFNLWFVPYSWSYQGQNVYTDSSKTTSVDVYGKALTPNTRYYFTLAALNTGSSTWTQGQVRLGTLNDQSSPLYDSTWISPLRAATMVESSVAPGQTGHFEFWVKTPNSLYSGNQYFNLVVEGVTWMNNIGLNWPLNRPVFTWQYQGQNVYTDNTKSTSVDSYSQALTPNNRYYFTLAAKNTGNVTWKQGQVNLGTSKPGDRISPINDPTWLSGARPATLLESSVAPGQTGHFEFWVKTPNSLYSGLEYFNLLAEGLTWMNDPGLSWVLNRPVFSWRYQGQAVYTDNTKSTYIDSYGQHLASNTRYYFTLAALNTGNVTWKQGQVNLGTSKPGDRISPINDPTWLSGARPATLLESSVAPGQTGHFEFWVKTPSSPYSGLEYYNLLDEGVIWFNDIGLNWVINSP